MKGYPTKTICFFNSNRAWGGGEKWHLTTAKEFQHRGFKTLLVGNLGSDLAKKATQEHLKIFTFSVTNLSFLNPLKIFTLMAFFKSHRVNAIVMNLPSDLKLAGIAAKCVGIKTIIYRRGMPHPLRNTWLNRFLFKKILSHVVVNSEEIGRSLIQGNEEWFPKDKVVLIYNGVDTHLPLPSGKKLYEKQADEIVIGNAARLTEQKGQKYLIQMAKILKARGTKFRLLIAGEGELRSELQKEIEQEGLEKEIKLLGHVQDMPGFLSSLDVFVFPSLYEGSANTLIETLQFGLPSVAFDISSNPEIIQHQVNGLLARPFEASDLAQCVLEIVESPELRAKFVANGKKFVQEKFDSKRNLNRLQDLI